MNSFEKTILTSLHNISNKSSYEGLTLSIPYLEEIFKLLDKHKYNKILIIDDKDADGTLGTLCVNSILQRLGFNNIDIWVNTQHGVCNTVLNKSNAKDYLLLIIIDSSTNLYSLYKGRMYDTIIIDHHIPDQSPDKIDNKKYNNDLVYDNIVLNINNKFKGFESVRNLSAGFLAFLIMREYAKRNNVNVDDLERLAITTLYSDIVESDLTVQNYIINYLFNTNTKYNPKHKLNFNTIPQINSIRRMNDISACKGLYNNSPVSAQLMNNTYLEAKKVLAVLMRLKKVNTDYKNIVVINLDTASQYLDIPITNFKGLICNMVNISGYNINLAYTSNQDEYDISVRSSGVDTLNHIMKLKQKYNITGGGHLQASGFRIKKDLFNNFLVDFDNSLNSVESLGEHTIQVEDINEIHNYDLSLISLINEFNTDKDVSFIVNVPTNKILSYKDYIVIDGNKFSYGRNDINYLIEGGVASINIRIQPFINNMEINQNYKKTECYITNAVNKFYIEYDLRLDIANRLPSTLSEEFKNILKRKEICNE